MATRSRHPRRKWRRPAPDPAPPAKQEPAEAASAEQAKPENVIRKGLYLSALIYVEGDMPAPNDFISPATKALKSVLEQALKGEHEGLSMTLKKVEVQNDVEQDEEEAKDSGQEEEKFRF